MSMYLKRAEDSGNSKQRPEWNDLWICVLQRCVRARTQRECRLYAYLYTYLCIYVCFDKKLRKPNHAYFGFTHIFAYFTHNQFACNARTYVYTFICKCVCEKWLVTYNLITKFQKSEWHNYSQNPCGQLKHSRENTRASTQYTKNLLCVLMKICVYHTCHLYIRTSCFLKNQNIVSIHFYIFSWSC